MIYKDAEKLAEEYSIIYPEERFYICWNECDDFIVVSIPDYNWQDYYLNGEFIYGETLDKND